MRAIDPILKTAELRMLGRSLPMAPSRSPQAPAGEQVRARTEELLRHVPSQDEEGGDKGVVGSPLTSPHSARHEHGHGDDELVEALGPALVGRHYAGEALYGGAVD